MNYNIEVKQYYYGVYHGLSDFFYLNQVNPNNDITGSYGKKIYNHSCTDLIKYLNRGKGKLSSI